jgi:predicted GNAT superfamily acetyltransferase
MHVTQIDIKVLTAANELKKVRDLEAEVWNGDDPVPVHQTATAAKHGGLVLGAFDGDQLIGFQYSFAGFDGQKSYLCSHTLGMKQAYRSKGIGEKLKWKQREEALRLGYDLITWTYDPLETANGYLNIKKLGAVCKNYLVNFYGDMTDTLNEGLPSDRFMVEWRIKEKRKPHDSPEEGISVIQTDHDENQFPIASMIDLTQTNTQTTLLVPVPAAFQTLKQQTPAAAYDWRMKTRAVFTHYFQHGWQVTHFIKNEIAPHACHQYVLSKHNNRGETND